MNNAHWTAEQVPDLTGKTVLITGANSGIGFYTADEYIRGVYEKLQVKSRGSAIAKALKERLVPPQGG